MSLVCLLEQNDGTKEMVQACLDLVSKSNGVIIFGAGIGGAKIYSLLRDNGLNNKILAWTDNNKLKHMKTYQDDNLYILPPEHIKEKYGSDIDIVIASSAYIQLFEQLQGYGFAKERIHLYNFAFMDLEYTDKEYIFDHISDFERAYNRMEDEKSRKIFVDILNYKITKKNSWLEDMQNYVDCEEHQYFEKELFDFRSEETFLDVGAYIGDTLKAFDEHYEGNWNKYIGLEADEYVYSVLKQFVNESQFRNKVKTINIAAWDSETILHFENNAGSSTMETEEKRNSTSVSANCVDSILGDEKITFIKMDIEGAEYNALLGMENLIKKNTPVLAICVYHLRDDFFKLTDYVENICPNKYKFYMRQYRYTPTETVCFAVPLDRVKQ